MGTRFSPKSTRHAAESGGGPAENVDGLCVRPRIEIGVLVEPMGIGHFHECLAGRRAYVLSSLLMTEVEPFERICFYCRQPIEADAEHHRLHGLDYHARCFDQYLREVSDRS
jgi:hypothetical protein